VVGEPDAIVVARLCWMAIGGLNAVLCGLVLLPLGRLAAMLTGLMYAVYFGAVYVEHTVLLEPPGTTVQAYALEYLRTGDAVVIARFSSGVGFSPETAKVVRGGLSSAGLGATLFAFPSRDGRRGVSHGGL
jgi:hypothetical protein